MTKNYHTLQSILSLTNFCFQKSFILSFKYENNDIHPTNLKLVFIMNELLQVLKKNNGKYLSQRGWKPLASSVYQPCHKHSILSISHQKTSPRIHFNAWAMTLKAIAGSVISRNFYNLFNNTPHRILYRKITWPSKLTPRGFCTLWHMIEFDIPCSYLVLSF